MYRSSLNLCSRNTHASGRILSQLCLQIHPVTTPKIGGLLEDLHSWSDLGSISSLSVFIIRMTHCNFPPIVCIQLKHRTN